MEKDKRLMEASWWERLTEGKLGPVLMGRTRLSKFLIQFSVNGWGCVSSLLFNLGPNYGGDNEDNGNLLQKVPCTYCYTQWPQPCSRLPPTHTFAGDSWTFTGKAGSLSCGGHRSFLLGPGAHKALFVPSKSLVPQSCVSSGGSNSGLFPEGFSHIHVCCTQSPWHCSRPLLTSTPTGHFLGQTTFSLFNVSFVVISKALKFSIYLHYWALIFAHFSLSSSIFMKILVRT